MNVIHGIWDSSHLHLWGEEATGQTERRRRGVRGQPAHPFALDVDRVREAVVSLLGGDAHDEVAPGELALRLPSDKHGPLPSLDRLQPGALQTAQGLSTWRVPSLAFGAPDALQLLAGLPEVASERRQVETGPSLRYWAEAAKLSLELLVHGLFVPDAEEVNSRQVRSVWRPLLKEGDIPERLRLLVAAMPPVCRALEGDQRQRRPGSLVGSFLNATVDASVRAACRSHRIVFGGKRGQSPTLAGRWLSSLVSQEPNVVAPAEEASHFREGLRQWTGGMVASTDGAAFRTCFRLEEPGGTGDMPTKGPPTWSLTFHLQALDDRSLLIDAGRVWRERSAELSLLKRRFENPQERLLADLGRASRLLPALEKGLRSPRPAACSLTTPEAHTFLRESAHLLEQAGFGVLVPPWWQKPSARLGLRLKVRAKGAGQAKASGLLGLDSLVDFQWEIALGPEKLSKEELEGLAALKVPLVQVRGQWIELRPEEVETALSYLEKKRGGVSLRDALRLGLAGDAKEAGLPVVAFEGEGWLDQVLDGLTSGKRLEELATPGEFQGALRPYQARGLSWLAFLDRFGLGACLADDMGLGKTIQLIALLLHERASQTRPGPTLLVAPTSVMGNWQREVARFAPSLSVMAHHGGQRLAGKGLAREAKKHDLVITTYALVHRDLADLSAVPWRRVVVDEAQNIKNSATKQAQAVRGLKSAHRVALTGTPVENRLSELWSIMEFLNPGYLGSAESFRRSYAIPIEKYRDADQVARLRSLVQPFILRRLKTDPAIIQDLPEKLEMKVFCHLTKEQASLYEAVVKDMVEKIESTEGIERKGLVLATLAKLKEVCDHPALFLHDASPLDGRSGKLVRLVEMLEEVLEAGDRALVFTQFAEMGKMLRGHLQNAMTSEVLFLHGGTPRAARDEMVRHFQSGDGPPIFVLSLKAGGLGLNLTSASHVFHFDRWWNPAVENQATDRAYRIGQHKNVQVHKYVCAGTLEERIDQMIEEKKELAENVMGTGEGWLTEMSTDQLRQLFVLSREAVMED
ncbi:MAG: DEAD/DEAH box helicase [Chloroflexi bacterium]|nr:DEAD/DEAH box helicase [Chloroflexota bacterium]